MPPARSAGLLLWRRTTGTHEVLVAHPGGPLWARRDERAWTIPKGEYVASGPGAEAPLDAARREFAEELGSPAPPGEPFPLGEVRQRNGKVVVAWAVEGEFDVTTVSSNTFEMEWPPRSGRRQEFPEIDRAAWVDLETAGVRLVAAQTAFLERLPWVGQ
ncbi:Predicted NTP pyrophosphohydrolase, NUDIX family [Jatrophihabitans endophyticus]|uniref:Predicted NTP pyrophosphohydrolase, NUDIX family n=1 Tax=Jatrophihabitans endophyticus TaxID=1206085 RepID=A0A1M5E2W0_9ACTN|nr:NUDIX domain-containing protein [Jatrophihabitans endophyticus]SHF73559.1 Predicted NTP pyrophosphohydrolase, NUDIX family [Jatrophihabitans endophyticus]